jgi:hypothetical protein
MIIHITPRLYLAGLINPKHCELIDLTIEECALALSGGRELKSCSPYPNKNYLVGCRKQGRKAIAGIFVDTQQRYERLTVVTRWAVNADAIVKHRINYVMIDDDYDAASDNMVLWNGVSQSLGGWNSRWPTWAEGMPPASSQPRMDIFPAVMTGAERQGDVHDTLASASFISERNETFQLPTIERERLLGRLAAMERLPALETAFKVA